MDQMANFVASGWKRDLTHFISCCWVAQIGSWNGRVARGHHQVSHGNGQTEGLGVDGYKRI